MKKISFLLLMLFASQTYAQQAINKGDVVAQDGVFLTKEEAAKVIAEKQAAEKVCKITATADAAVDKQKCEMDKAVLSNQIDFEKKKFDEISKLRDAQEKDLYKRAGDGGDNLYWFFGGLAAGAATVVAAGVVTIVIINQVTKK